MDDGIPDGEVGDQLPADLDPYGYVGPYQFPDNSRRRITGAIYLAVAVGVVALVALAEDSPLLNGGVVVAAVGLAVLGLYHLQAGWPLGVDEADALVVAIRCAGFPVGHASAQMAWRGLRSRPTCSYLELPITSAWRATASEGSTRLTPRSVAKSGSANRNTESLSRARVCLIS